MISLGQQSTTGKTLINSQRKINERKKGKRLQRFEAPLIQIFIGTSVVVMRISTRDSASCNTIMGSDIYLCLCCNI